MIVKNKEMQVKSKINIDDFLTLIYWIKTFVLIEGKKFNHQNLLEQAETYKIKDTPLDTTIHHIDDLMVDAFQIYHKLKETQEKVNIVLDQIQIPFITKDMMINETKKYERVFEDLMENYQYEDPEIRGIQKGFLTEKMAKYVADEDYENAAKVRDMIKNC
jgi:hypothetical protein